jgi:hypothetical protein
VLFKPLPNADHRALVGVWRRLWPVKDTHFTEKHDSDPAAFALGNLSAKFNEQGLDVVPLQVGRCRVREERP